MQNDMAYDVKGMLMWHDMIEWWCVYFTCEENDLMGHQNIGILFDNLAQCYEILKYFIFI
jgi:hypothetical protein